MNIPLLPRRSPTCPKTLENAVEAGERRIANLLGAVDRSLSGLEGFSTDSQDTLKADDLPVPRFMLDAHCVESDDMDIESSRDHVVSPERKIRVAHKHHRSDSGIGSSVTDPDEMKQNADEGHSPSAAVSEVRSGINGSSFVGTQHALSEYACRQIQKFIISPIVRESSLKDFHPLVQGIPYRVSRKEITCLRDLEKVLLWLAPKWSISKSSFLNFCETSIQCIHTTVDYLNESDQRRPTDRPYTNGYFLDLTEQVRQYAAMITAARERMAAGRGTADDEAMANERLGLHGGLSRNGRPVELVRTRNGQAISLRTGTDVKTDSNGTLSPKDFKRSASEELDDDLLRSMGRRRKGAPPPKDIHHCRDCEKVFKRPCDLTKHEKTHSRPWKCSETGCKYHEYGWPTEKERDRHMNDKHSAAPSMFKCHFRPCPYESKRESNCKQHMEKAHGWAYVRSKNNGKASKKPQHTKATSKPQMTTPGSNVFDAASPVFSHASYTSRGSISHSVSGSVAASDESAPFSSVETPFMSLEDTFGPFNANINWNEPHNSAMTANPSPYTPESHQLSWDEASMSNAPTGPSFETSVPPVEDSSLFTDNYDWSNLNTDFTSYNIQLVTPAASIDTQSIDPFSRNPSISMEKPVMDELPSLSPCAQGNVMLYSPYSQNDCPVDEGFEDFVGDVVKPPNDFTLFENCQPTPGLGNGGNEHMFQPLSASAIPCAWSGRGTEFAQQMGVSDLMQVDEE